MYANPWAFSTMFEIQPDSSMSWSAIYLFLYDEKTKETCFVLWEDQNVFHTPNDYKIREDSSPLDTAIRCLSEYTSSQLKEDLKYCYLVKEVDSKFNYFCLPFKLKENHFTLLSQYPENLPNWQKTKIENLPGVFKIEQKSFDNCNLLCMNVSYLNRPKDDSEEQVLTEILKLKKETWHHLKEFYQQAYKKLNEMHVLPQYKIE